MTSGKSSFERLHEAGIIEGSHFSAEDKKVIAKITEEEVEVLIKLRHKMGDVPAGKAHFRPNVAV